jgi:hypothetical protein
MILMKLIFETIAKSSAKEESVIPGKQSATRNPVPPSAGFKQFWIPVFAGMTEQATFARGSF